MKFFDETGYYLIRSYEDGKEHTVFARRLVSENCPSRRGHKVYHNKIILDYNRKMHMAWRINYRNDKKELSYKYMHYNPGVNTPTYKIIKRID